MRNRLTNLLQVFVLLTGLFYMSLGGLYFFRPDLFGKILTVSLNSEWTNQIKIDDFLILLYLLSKCCAILFVYIGSTMVMPLYDPLRYRELAYFNGVFFPLGMASYMGFQLIRNGYRATMYFGIIFFGIAALNLLGLYLTKANARRGID